VSAEARYIPQAMTEEVLDEQYRFLVDHRKRAFANPAACRRGEPFGATGACRDCARFDMLERVLLTPFREHTPRKKPQLVTAA